MESAVYSIVQVDVRNLEKNKLWIAREWHYPPDYIDRMPYFMYEWVLKEINDYNKKEEKRQKEEEKKYNQKQAMPNYNRMMNNAMAGMRMPSMPAMPKYY